MKFQVSRRTDVALRALRFCHTAGRPVPGKELAKATESGPAYLSQCLTPLVQAGWLSSRTGPDGGYEATDQASKVTLLAVFELMEGPLADGRCVLNKRACSSSNPCTLHATWSAAREDLRSALAATLAVT